MKEYEFHPLAGDYDLFSAHELGRMEEGMRERGFDPRFPVVLYEGKILDGRNRYLAAKAAGLKKVPTTVFKGTDEEASRFVQTANEERRHLAVEWLQQRRRERIERVAEARQEGKSTRTIADQEKVSQAQVVRDLKAATETGVSVDPPGGKVTGKDQRTRTATPAKPAILCDRCKRAQPGVGIEGCGECRRLRNGTGGPGPAPPPPKPQREPGDDTEDIRREHREERDHTRDREGHPVPEHLAPAFATLALFEELDSLVRKLQRGIDNVSRLPGGEGLRHDLQATGEEGKTVNKSEHLNALKRDLNGRRPHSVCPYCRGKAAASCKGCSGLGWVTRTTWRDAAADVKAGLA